jgi:hypothetical protein
MRHVAGETPFSLRQGGVSFRHRFPLLSMTLKTDAVPAPDQENRVTGCVRIMAGKAFSFAEGIVEDRSPCLQFAFVMALVT